MKNLDFSDYISKVPDEIPKGYFNMDEAEYHRFPALSAGVLKENTAAEALWNRIKPEEDSDEKESLVLGTLTHAACLEPWKFSADKYQNYYAMSPTKGLGTKAAQEAREAPENKGKLLVTQELLTTAWRIRREGIETNPAALLYLNSPNGIAEATGICWDPVNDCRRKIRIDYLPMSGRSYGDGMLDIKTTRLPLYSFYHEAMKRGYFLSACYYLDTHELLTGHRMEYYRWLVVTNTEPFMSRVFYMRNLKPTDPLYKDSTLQKARERLGLDASAKVGRITQFLNSLREHEVARRDGVNLDHRTLRGFWPGYEGEDLQEIL